jgi:hypothetical protein
MSTPANQTLNPDYCNVPGIIVFIILTVIGEKGIETDRTNTTCKIFLAMRTLIQLEINKFRYYNDNVFLLNRMWER